MDRNRGGRPRHPDVLTPAEWRVLEALRDGGTNAGIGARLGLSLDTVKYHISNMLAKLELRDRRALASWRPDPERRRLGAVLAVPAVLWSVVGRPLVWVGAGYRGTWRVWSSWWRRSWPSRQSWSGTARRPRAVARLPATPSTAPPAVTVAPTATPSVFAAEPALAPFGDSASRAFADPGRDTRAARQPDTRSDGPCARLLHHTDRPDVHPRGIPG